MSAEAFVVLVAALDESDGMPLAWREHGRYGNEPAAIHAAAELRNNSRVARIFAENDHELTMILAQRAAQASAPTDLYAVSIRDTLGHHMVIDGEWLQSREEAQARADACGGTVITASGSGPRGASGI